MSINPLFAVMANVPSSSSSSYPETLGGLYTDHIITPDQVKDIYYELLIKGHVIQPSPLSEAFVNPTNVEYLRQQVEKNLQQYTRDSSIRYLLTNEFAQTMIDMIQNNQQLAYDVQVGLPILNDLVVHQETEMALLYERHHKRYVRWALHNDRPKVMPYGFGDKTNHVKGENQVVPSGYELNHPFKSQYQMYLRDVLHLQCPSNSNRPCPMPPFPIQFASP
jgi:hypothetical protein